MNITNKCGPKPGEPLPQIIPPPGFVAADEQSTNPLQLPPTKGEQLGAEIRSEMNSMTAEQRAALPALEDVIGRPDQSAVEWVKKAKNKGIEWVPIGRLEDIARRCDEAEIRLQALRGCEDTGDDSLYNVRRLRAQLAEAQSESASWKSHAEKLQTALDRAHQAAEVHQADYVQRIAAAKDESAALRATIEARSAEIEGLTRENTALRVAWENAEARERELLEVLVEIKLTSTSNSRTLALDVYRFTARAIAKHKPNNTEQ